MITFKSEKIEVTRRIRFELSMKKDDFDDLRIAIQSLTAPPTELVSLLDVLDAIKIAAKI